uniref:Cyclin dependent kinase 2 associated protein 2 n=1 Tax=Chrysemys picta bellii TaxID=8478 RepID=A0A8C3HPF8_CHRPI
MRQARHLLFKPQDGLPGVQLGCEVNWPVPTRSSWLCGSFSGLLVFHSVPWRACLSVADAARFATSVPSPSGSVPGASAPFRPLFNDFGPPSMGYVQAMKPPGSQGSQSTYTDLLSVIEEMGKEIRPTYAGSKSAMERLKRGIIHARALVRECLAETERNART